jgi:AraC-like DNA-binding protein
MNVGTRHLAKMLHALIRQHAAGKNTDGLLAALRVTVASIILETARHHEQSKPAAQVSMAAQLIDHMERHLSEPISMDALATHARTSRARLFANFKRETGMSPNDWLQRRRIKAATDLLRTTNRKLEDIADDAVNIGFACQPLAHFIRVTHADRVANNHDAWQSRIIRLGRLLGLPRIPWFYGGKGNGAPQPGGKERKKARLFHDRCLLIGHSGHRLIVSLDQLLSSLRQVAIRTHFVVVKSSLPSLCWVHA